MSADFMVPNSQTQGLTSGKILMAYRLIRHYFRSQLQKNACLKHIHLFTVNHFVTAVTL